MKRLTAALLALTICLLNTLSLTSCGKGKENGKKGEIRLPPYRDHGRGTVDFYDIEYTRPDVDLAVGELEKTAEIIEKNAISYEEQLAKIKSLEVINSDISTAAAFANLMSSKDTEDEYWSGEYEYITLAYPAFRQAAEALFAAAARSPNAERFERDYFGEGLIEEYGDGGKMTDALVLLMEEEARLIALYSSLSRSTVKITYGSITATYDEVCEALGKKLGEGSKKHRMAIAECERLYKAALLKTTAEILIDLFKVRRDIADALSLDSYALYAYGDIYHDYSPEDYMRFAGEIRKYILPVYSSLADSVFSARDNSALARLDRVTLINSAGDALKRSDSELYSIYSYMLQHSLFDISPASESRFCGAFTTYLDNYSAPFLFISSEESVLDYSTLFHEFGHFADAYMNYNGEASIDLSEVSSQALELLSLVMLEGAIDGEEYDALRLYLFENALSTLIFQGFYACFEEIAYSIPRDEITRESLDGAVGDAAEMMGLRRDSLNNINAVLIPHIIRYPFYVQSYTVSLAASSEVYFKELDKSGEGIRIYKELLTRDEKCTFEESLASVGLTSPFSEGYLRIIADRIHTELTGSPYFNAGEADDAAA